MREIFASATSRSRSSFFRLVEVRGSASTGTAPPLTWRTPRRLTLGNRHRADVIRATPPRCWRAHGRRRCDRDRNSSRANDPLVPLVVSESTLTPCAPFQRDRRESELHDDGRDAVLKPLHVAAGLRSIAVATYQAVSGPVVKASTNFRSVGEVPRQRRARPHLRRVRVSAGLRRQVPGHHCAQRDPDGGDDS